MGSAPLVKSLLKSNSLPNISKLEKFLNWLQTLIKRLNSSISTKTTKTRNYKLQSKVKDSLNSNQTLMTAATVCPDPSTKSIWKNVLTSSKTHCKTGQSGWKRSWLTWSRTNCSTQRALPNKTQTWPTSFSLSNKSTSNRPCASASSTSVNSWLRLPDWGTCRSSLRTS